MFKIFTGLDLRALQREFIKGLEAILKEELDSIYGSSLSGTQQTALFGTLIRAMEQSLDRTTAMDNSDRMHAATSACSSPILDFLSRSSINNCDLNTVVELRARVATRAISLHDQLVKEFVTGERGAAPASAYMGRTKSVYEFVRVTLGVRMHGAENYGNFVNALGFDEVSVGQNISLIHEVRIFPLDFPTKCL